MSIEERGSPGPTETRFAQIWAIEAEWAAKCPKGVDNIDIDEARRFVVAHALKQQDKR